MTEPKNQHIAPQVYLKQFAVDGLIVYDRRADLDAQAESPTIEHDLRKVAAEEHFYTLWRAEGADYAMEHAFTRIENFYKSMQKPLRTRGPFPQEVLLDMAFLAAVQDARSPRNRDLLVAGLEEARNEIVRSHLDGDATLSEYAAERIADDILRRDVVDADMLMTPKNISLLAIPLAIRFNYDMFRHMAKCIVYSESQDFLTSDSPVSFIDPAQYPRRPLERFFAFSASMEVTFPLSRKSCLMMAWQPMKPVAVADEWTVAALNARAAQSSENYIFAPNRNMVESQRRNVRDMRDGVSAIGLPLSNIFAEDESGFGEAALREVRASYRACLQAAGFDVRKALELNAEIKERYIADKARLDEGGP